MHGPKWHYFMARRVDHILPHACLLSVLATSPGVNAITQRPIQHATLHHHHNHPPPPPEPSPRPRRRIPTAKEPPDSTPHLRASIDSAALHSGVRFLLTICRMTVCRVCPSRPRGCCLPPATAELSALCVPEVV